MQQTATHRFPVGLAEVETPTPMLLCCKLIWKLIKLINDCYNTLSPISVLIDPMPYITTSICHCCPSASCTQRLPHDTPTHRLTHDTPTHPGTDLNSSPIPAGILHTYAQDFCWQCTIKLQVGATAYIYISSASPAASELLLRVESSCHC